MKFKIDENLPEAIARLLRWESHDAVTVIEQKLQGTADSKLASICRKEDRILITLDLDFANTQDYPLAGSSGIIVIRLHRQSKRAAIRAFRRVVPMLRNESLKNHL